MWFTSSEWTAFDQQDRLDLEYLYIYLCKTKFLYFPEWSRTSDEKCWNRNRKWSERKIRRGTGSLPERAWFFRKSFGELSEGCPLTVDERSPEIKKAITGKIHDYITRAEQLKELLATQKKVVKPPTRLEVSPAAAGWEINSFMWPTEPSRKPWTRLLRQQKRTKKKNTKRLWNTINKVSPTFHKHCKVS